MACNDCGDDENDEAVATVASTDGTDEANRVSSMDEVSVPDDGSRHTMPTVETCEPSVPCPPCPPKVKRCPPAPEQVKPYYSKAAMCPSDSVKTILTPQITLAIKNRTTFRMPDCGGRVFVEFESVGDVPLGGWLWAYGVGVLEVVGVSDISNELELENVCPTNSCAEDQLAPGSLVPGCTQFIFGRPDCCSDFNPDSENTPYLNSGFIAPAIGDCVEIAVTNIVGIVAGNTVAIQGGIYNVSMVINTNLIEICNDGQGLTPGTVVDPKDSSCRNLIVPIVPLTTNPCSEELVELGVVVVCDNGSSTGMTGKQADQVLSLVDPVTGEAQYKTIGFPLLSCTELTVGLTIDPGFPDATSYPIQVTDTTEFAVNDSITISSTVFTIDVIDSGTLIHATPVVVPPVFTNFPVGAVVCTTDCCTLLEERVDLLEANDDDDGNPVNYAVANQNDAAAISATTINAGTPTLAGNIATLTVTNLSQTYQMGVHYTVDHDWVYDLMATDAKEQDIGHFTEFVVDPSAVAALGLLHDLPKTYIFQTVTSGTAGINRQSYSKSHSGFFVIPVGESRSIRAKATISFNAGDMTGVDVKILSTRISVLGIAVA